MSDQKAASGLVKGDRLTLTVTGVNNLGCGVCRAPDGRAVFVAGAVTGDAVEAELIKVTATYAVGKLLAVKTPSPDRVDDFCAAPLSCGGCVYRCLAYEREIAEKRDYVRFAFRKAGLDPVVEEVRTAGPVSGYRNKAEYPIARQNGHLYGGFYAPRTHTVIPADDCALVPPVFGAILGTVCRLFESRGIEAYDEKTGRGMLRHLYLREASGTGEIMVCPVLKENKLSDAAGFAAALTRAYPQIVSVMLNINPDHTNVVLGKTFYTVWGRSYLTDTLCGKRFMVGPAAFYQVNHDATELLYRLAAERAGRGDLLLDLYCGVGTVGLSMADRFSRLVGVEIVPDAVNAARQNARENGVKNAAFYCGDAADTEKLLAVAEQAEGKLLPDAVILDPPRRGCDEKLLRFLAEREMPRIVYISCNPDTLARDAAVLVGLGYEMGIVTPVNMFPRTGHVECVVRFCL